MRPTTTSVNGEICGALKQHAFGKDTVPAKARRWALWVSRQARAGAGCSRIARLRFSAMAFLAGLPQGLGVLVVRKRPIAPFADQALLGAR